MLIGVNNDGDVVGIPKGTPLDEMQLAIVNAVQHTCRPRPRFETRCLMFLPIHPDVFSWFVCMKWNISHAWWMKRCM
jgi:hypothetical protein